MNKKENQKLIAKSSIEDQRSSETSRSEDDVVGEEIHFINPLVENSSNELINETKTSEIIKNLKSSIHQ